MLNRNPNARKRRLRLENLESRRLLALLSQVSEGEGTVFASDTQFVLQADHDVQAMSAGEYSQDSEQLQATLTYRFDQPVILSIDVDLAYDYTPPAALSHQPLFGSGMRYDAPIWLRQTDPDSETVWAERNWLLGEPFGEETPLLTQAKSNHREYSKQLILEPGTYEFDSSGITTLVSAGRFSSDGNFGTGMELQTSTTISVDIDSPRELVGDAVALVPNGQQMQAQFAPHYPDGSPIRLYDLQAALGVDHFNWLQTVSGPDEMEIQIVDGSGDFLASTQFPVHNPIVRTRGDEQYQLRVSDQTGGERTVVANDGIGADSEIPYYHLAGEARLYYERLDNGMEVFAFRDTPALPDWFGEGIDHALTFTTELVGVKSDGTIIYFRDQPGTRFRWKSDVLYETSVNSMAGRDVAYLSNPQDLDLQLSGSVYDVAFVATDPLDANLDGEVTPRDVLNIINFIATNESDAMFAGSEFATYDTDANGKVTPHDALLVMNRVGLGLSFPVAEGEMLTRAEGEMLPPESLGAGAVDRLFSHEVDDEVQSNDEIAEGFLF